MSFSAPLSGARAPQSQAWAEKFVRLFQAGAWRSVRFTGLGPQFPALLLGDAAIARQIYRGTFTFAGHTISCRPAEVFAAPPPSSAWWDELASFDWLRHFDEAGLVLYRAYARAQIVSFAAQRRPTSFQADCRRLLALSRHAHFLLTDSSDAIAAELLGICAREAQRLAALRPRAIADQLRQAVALAAAGLAFRGPAGPCDDALARCAALAAAMILPDGGPADRNPGTLLNLLADFIALREALDHQMLAVPQGLHAAIERGLPMLRFLSHDGASLVVFQGVEDAANPLLAAVLARDPVQGLPLAHPAYAGYCRMTQGRASVIVDCGESALCESPLAFELCDGGQRVAGNCGLPVHASLAWREAARSIRAHATLEVELPGASAAPAFLARRRSSATVAAEFVASPHGTLVKGCNRTFVARTGLIHRRDLFLAANGHDLRGEDQLAREEGQGGDWPDLGFSIRFHLAPGSRATLDRPGNAVTLVLPDRAVWQFSVRGGEPHLEDSIFLATGGAPETCKQIVIRGRVGRPDRINWAFKKLAVPAVKETGTRRAF